MSQRYRGNSGRVVGRRTCATLDQIRKPGLASVDAVRGNHPRTSHRHASSELLKTQARTILFDEGLTVEFPTAVAGSTFHLYALMAKLPKRQEWIVGIISHLLLSRGCALLILIALEILVYRGKPSCGLRVD